MAVLLASYSHVFAQYGTRIIDVDSTGAIHITGTFSDELTLGDTTIVSEKPEENTAFLAVLESEGTLRWVRQIGSGDRTNGVAAIKGAGDGGGYLVVHVYDSLFIDSTKWIYEDAVIRYTTGGEFKWTASDLGDSAVDLTLSGNGRIHVVSNPHWHGTLNLTTVDSSGVVLQKSRLAVGQLLSSVAADGNGRISIGGLASDHIMVSQYESIGKHLWSFLSDGGGWWASSVVIDRSGSTFFGARSMSGIQLADSVVASTSGRYVGRISPDGRLEWIHPINGPRGGSEVEVLLHEDRISAVMTVTDDPSPFENSLLLSEWDFSGNVLSSVTVPGIWVWVADARNFSASRGDDLYFIGYALEPPDPDVLETILYDPESLTFVGKRRVDTHVKSERPEGYDRGTISTVYPNPARANIIVEYSLSATAPVTIEICDALGRCMRRINHGIQTTGKHVAHIGNGSLAPGVYFVRVVAGPNVSIAPVHIIR